MSTKTEAKEGREALAQIRVCVTAAWRAVVSGTRALAHLILNSTGDSNANRE